MTNGHFGILTTINWHQDQLRHRHGLKHCKNDIFTLRNFFLENRTLMFIALIFIFVLLFSCLPSLSLWDNYLLLSNSPFIHPQSSTGLLEKRLEEFSKIPVHQCFEKKAALKILRNISVKYPWWSPFEYRCRTSWDFSKKLSSAGIVQRTFQHLFK